MYLLIRYKIIRFFMRNMIVQPSAITENISIKKRAECHSQNVKRIIILGKE